MIKAENYDIKTNFAMCPRNILRAHNLSSQCKVVLILLIDRYNYLSNPVYKGSEKLRDALIKQGDPFYYIAEDFEEQTDIKAQTIQKSVIPQLVSKGLITKLTKPEKDKMKYKTYTYYYLNFDAINNFNDEPTIAENISKAKKEEDYKRRQKKRAKTIAAKQESQILPEATLRAIGCTHEELQLPVEYRSIFIREEDFILYLKDHIKRLALHELGYYPLRDYDTCLNDALSVYCNHNKEEMSEAVAREKLKLSIEKSKEQIRKLIPKQS